MKAYSLDLRQKVLAAALRGDRTIREVAESFGVGTTFVDKVPALHRASEDLAPWPHGGGYPARLPPRYERLLRSQVRRQKDATLEELRAHLEAGAGLSVSAPTVSRALIRFDLGRNKVRRRASVTTTSAGGYTAALAGLITGGSSSSMRRPSTPR